MISGLYLITDDNHDGRLFDKVAGALRGGARIVQYRAKDIPIDERLANAKKLRDLCHRHQALFIINDLPELARDVDADGVHLGQDDMSVAEARRIIGHSKQIGVSTHSVDEALKAEGQGADYVAIGSLFPTGSKADITLVGLPMLRRVRKAVSVPVVGIGGMTPERAFDVLEAGADAVAVMSGIMGDDNPTRAAREYSLLFNRKHPYPKGKVLTIAGSDSGGGAGIQADIKTITLLGGYAASVVTALTAQNTTGVVSVYDVDTGFVTAQIDAVLDDIGADTIKTGMLNTGEIVRCVAKFIAERDLMAVVDPVMVAKGGASLLNQEAQDSLISQLLPQTYLLTPNLPEIAALTGIQPQTTEQMIEAGQALQSFGVRNVLIKGGHLKQDATDVLLMDNDRHLLTSPRIDSRNTHGTGCTLSAAIAAFLAQGYPLKQAVEKSKHFITIAIAQAVAIGRGHGPVNHFQAAMQLLHEQSPMN